MGNLIVPSTATKVSKAEGFLIAHVGSGIFAQKAEKVVKDHGHETSVLSKVAELLDDDEMTGEALSVSYKRELIHVDNRGYMNNLDIDFWAIGSAEQLVLGRLLYIAESRAVTIEDAEAAVKSAALFDTSVDARVQKFYLSQ